jgi:hypothetical protein
LTDAEIEQLDAFLRKDQKAMSLEEIDGHFIWAIGNVPTAMRAVI